MALSDLTKYLSKLTALEAAERLIGAKLIRTIDNHKLIAQVVETEAYDQTDAASHSYRGLTKQNQIMFGPAGFAYVYFTYGMHYCFNVVVGKEGFGAAVLIRALMPLQGVEGMKINRPVKATANLLNGPAKLTQALNINQNLYGHDLSIPPLELILEKPFASNEICWSPRIGIKEDGDRILPWRASLKGSKYLSRKG